MMLSRELIGAVTVLIVLKKYWLYCRSIACIAGVAGNDGCQEVTPTEPVIVALNAAPLPSSTRCSLTVMVLEVVRGAGVEVQEE